MCIYPEAKTIYKERSPINHVKTLNVPVILFQGDEDKIVPPNQAQIMYEALKSKGLPVSLNIFVGEQHGFIQAKNIKTTLEREYYFFCTIFGIASTDIISLIVENL